MVVKNYSKAAKRRAKKASLPELADTPRRKARGRKRMAEIKSEPKAERTVFEARARQTSGKPADMNNPALAEAAGQAIYAVLGGDEAKAAWEAYAGLTAAEASYHRHYTGLRLYAKTAKLEMAPERFEARADDRPDLRTKEERSRDAVNRWMRWRGLVMHLASHQQEAIFDAAYGRCPQMDAGKVTGAGERTARACAALAKVVEKHR